MLVAFFAATWLTGLSLATAFAAAAYGFGRSVEPERTDLVSLAIFGVMGLASQAGLLLAPWATTRGLTSRIIAALLMGPAGVSLSIFATRVSRATRLGDLPLGRPRLRGGLRGAGPRGARPGAGDVAFFYACVYSTGDV